LTRQVVFNAATVAPRRGRALAKFWPWLLPLALAACEPAGAPTDIGICWRTIGAPSPKPRFAIVANDVGNLDDCAALLEAYHLQGAKTSNGAYQGYFILLDDRAVASSTRVDGFRYPIFQPSQRREIDADLIHLIKERGGHPPSPSDIAVERR